MALRRKISCLCLFHRIFYSPSLSQGTPTQSHVITPRLNLSCKNDQFTFRTSFLQSFFPKRVVGWNDPTVRNLTETNPDNFRSLIDSLLGIVWPTSFCMFSLLCKIFFFAWFTIFCMFSLLRKFLVDYFCVFYYWWLIYPPLRNALPRMTFKVFQWISK